MCVRGTFKTSRGPVALSPTRAGSLVFCRWEMSSRPAGSPAKHCRNTGGLCLSWGYAIDHFGNPPACLEDSRPMPDTNRQHKPTRFGLGQGLSGSDRETCGPNGSRNVRRAGGLLPFEGPNGSACFGKSRRIRHGSGCVRRCAACWVPSARSVPLSSLGALARRKGPRWKRMVRTGSGLFGKVRAAPRWSDSVRKRCL